tara:strand:- start:1408 stop:1653 length:246 start_codon:yes stop_codon:yes gene_type:complete
MNTINLLNNIELQSINNDQNSEYLSLMNASDEREIKLKKELRTKRAKLRALERKKVAYNNNYPIKHADAIQLIKNRFTSKF